MARTKQTARISRTASNRCRIRNSSTGNNNDAGVEYFNQQVDIYKERGTRTIVVEGTTELTEKPDIIHLSFIIDSETVTMQKGIQDVGSMITKVRAKALTLGVSNDQVFSDSISSKKLREEIGYYEKDNGGREQFKVVKTKITFKVSSVVRIFLQGDNIETTFSSLCYILMTKLGLRTYQAPVYELDNITELRNTARQKALENAKIKATSILSALNDTTVSLGPPISITDIHCNIQDDSEESFQQQFSGLEYITTRTTITKDDNIDNLQKNDDNDNHNNVGESNVIANKRPRLATTEDKTKDATMTMGDDDDDTKVAKEVCSSKNNDDADHDDDIDLNTAESIFVAPLIRVLTRVQTVFEIKVESTT